MQTEVKRPIKILNLVVAVIFVLLFAAHFYLSTHLDRWYNYYESFIPNMDLYLVRPLLGFTTGYALFSALFSLLHAKLEIEGLGRRNLLRMVMLAISAFFAAALLLVSAVLFLNLGPVEVDWYSRLFYLSIDVCRAEWLWLILGIYWFLSLNALRYKELRPLDDDEENF